MSYQVTLSEKSNITALATPIDFGDLILIRSTGLDEDFYFEASHSEFLSELEGLLSNPTGNRTSDAARELFLRELKDADMTTGWNSFQDPTCTRIILDSKLPTDIDYDLEEITICGARMDLLAALKISEYVIQNTDVVRGDPRMDLIRRLKDRKT